MNAGSLVPGRHGNIRTPLAAKARAAAWSFVGILLLRWRSSCGYLYPECSRMSIGEGDAGRGLRCRPGPLRQGRDGVSCVRRARGYGTQDGYRSLKPFFTPGLHDEPHGIPPRRWASTTNRMAAMSIGKGIAIAACVGGIVYLSANGHDGWGWLIFLAIIIA